MLPKGRVLVLGGAGTFGSRISGHLARSPNLQVVLAGRKMLPLQELKRVVESTNPRHGGVRAAHEVLMVQLDIQHPGALRAALQDLRPAVVIHTAGPFQGASYDVARECAEQQCHYLDLADDRAYVTGFGALDGVAKANGVTLLGGCSTTPALTTAVIDALAPEFSRLTSVDIALSPGNKLPRGVATIASVVSYCGKPFSMLKDGAADHRVVGWQGMRETAFPGVGSRLVSHCDVPDLSLLPRRYPALCTVEFRAGMELRVFGLGLWLFSRCLPNVDYVKLAGPLLKASLLFMPFGSDDGAMRVRLRGTRPCASGGGGGGGCGEGEGDGKGDGEGEGAGAGGRQQSGQQEEEHEVTWSMFAGGGDGPQTPVAAATILAEMAVAGRLAPGARPCMGEVTLQQFRAEVEGQYDFHFHTTDSGRRRTAERAGPGAGGAVGDSAVVARPSAAAAAAAAAAANNDNADADDDDDDDDDDDELARLGGMYCAFSRDVVGRLPPFMLHFHCGTGQRVEGVFDVTRGSNPLAWLIATSGQLPPAMTRAPTTVSSDGGTWRRVFGGSAMTSVKSTVRG